MFIPIILSLLIVIPQLGLTNQLYTPTVHGFLEDLFGPRNKVTEKKEEITMVKDSCIDPTNAAIYANFDGIDGESEATDHEKWIEVLAFGFDMHTPTEMMTGTSRRRGDVVFEDIKLVKKIDKATPKLQEALAAGKVYSTVEIHFMKMIGSIEVTYLRYELKNVMVTSYLNTVDTCGVAQDVLTLNFEEVKMTYTELDEDGSSKGNVEWTWKVEGAES